MIDTAKKLLRVIDPSDYYKVFILAVVMFGAALTQATGVVSIVPFLAVVANQVEFGLGFLPSQFNFLCSLRS